MRVGVECPPEVPLHFYVFVNFCWFTIAKFLLLNIKYTFNSVNIWCISFNIYKSNISEK